MVYLTVSKTIQYYVGKLRHLKKAFIYVIIKSDNQCITLIVYFITFNINNKYFLITIQFCWKISKNQINLFLINLIFMLAKLMKINCNCIN